MSTVTLASLAELSDQELLARTVQLAADERRATALLIAHLAELDARRLYLAEGYSSLFTYCTEALRLSEHAAYGRIEAARVARKFPVVMEMLGEGSLTLTTVGLLAPHLTAENHSDLLNRARQKSKRAVEELLAGLYPDPLVPTTVRRLPAARLRPASPASLDTAPEGSSPNPGGQELAPTEPQAPTADPPPGRPAAVVPLAPQRYKVQFTASAETYEKLRLAQDLLRHQIPDSDLDQIFSRALTALLGQLARQKFAATDRPPAGRATTLGRATTPGSRHIPAEVKRAVWLQDGGRCAFVGASGRRCTATGFLEFHHVRPHAVGGASTIDNIQLRCRAHNAYEAELYFGPRTANHVGETPACYSVRTEFGYHRRPNSRGNHGKPRQGIRKQVSATWAPRSVMIPPDRVRGELTFTFLRPPDRRVAVEAFLLDATDQAIVLATELAPTRPVEYLGQKVMDAGDWAVWFLFKGRSFDVGRVYRSSGMWMGFYVDVLEPVQWEGSDPKTLAPIVDLFLDLWVAPDGNYKVLDEDEFAEAVSLGHLTCEQVGHARSVLQELVAATARGEFPPAAVKGFRL